MDEEVGLDLPHGLVDAHAAEVRVDPPALPDRVARPDEAQVALLGRRRDEAAADGLAGGLEVGQVEEAHLVEHALPRRQAGQIDLGREVAIVDRVDARGPADLGHALGGGPAHPHPAGPVGPAPHDRPVTDHIADLHAIGHGRPGLGVRNDRGAPEQQAAGGGTGA